MLFACLSALILLNLIDLLGSIYSLKKKYMAEANRLANWIWKRYGAWGLVALKIIVVAAFVSAILLADHHQSWIVWWAAGFCILASAYPVVMLLLLWNQVRKFK